MVIPATPGALTSAAIGAQLGRLGNAIIDVQQLSIERQGLINRAKADLRACGDCPDRQGLQAAVEHWTGVDNSVREAEGAALRQMGLGQYRDLGELGAAMFTAATGQEMLTARQLREQAERERHEDLVNTVMNYCVATNIADLAKVDECIVALPPDFVESRDNMAVALCEKVDDARGCKEENVLLPQMKRLVREACRVDGSTGDRKLITDACDPSGAAAREVERLAAFDAAKLRRSNVNNARLVDIGPVQSVPRDTQYWYEYIVKGIENSRRFSLITCSYDNPAGTFVFWKDHAPRRFGEVISYLKNYAHPARNLGTRAVADCPDTAGEARMLRNQLLVAVDLTPPPGADVEEILPASADLLGLTPGRRAELDALVEGFAQAGHQIVRCGYLGAGRGFQWFSFWVGAPPSNLYDFYAGFRNMSQALGFSGVSRCPSSGAAAEALARALFQDAQKTIWSNKPAERTSKRVAEAAARRAELIQIAEREDAQFAASISSMRLGNGALVKFLVVGSDATGLIGDGIYPADADVSVAAVHAGLVKPGEPGIVTTEILRGVDRYEGSKKNGVTSRNGGFVAKQSFRFVD